MTTLDNRKTNGARDESVGPHRPRLVATLVEWSGVARALSFAPLSTARPARRGLTSRQRTSTHWSQHEHVRPCERCER